MRKLFIPYKPIYIFIFVSIIYLLTRWITFKGFNGADDLHYAMLAADMLHGQYHPFAITDVFAGRILLVSLQALIYFVAGISIYTSQLGTMAITILCCYLTCFKLISITNSNTVVISTALFYFNPVLNEANLGVMPDVYVMLAGILIILLWRKITTEKRQQTIIISSALAGVVIFTAMFFKENALIFIPFLFCMPFFDKSKHGLKAGLISMLTFCILILLSGCMYFYYTGDFFFRVRQIQTADYPNPCNFCVASKSDVITRLTYGVWKEFITTSFYPVILASFMMILKILFDTKYRIRNDRWAICFVILVILSLYFPFSLKGYQPLCFKARHFLFLLPLGVTVSTVFLEDAWYNKRTLSLFIVASTILLAVCITTTGEKWYWMIYGFLFMYFVLQKLLPISSFLYTLRYIMLGSILWIYMPYHLFFFNSNWFKDMQTLTKKPDGYFFYFPEHDNMRHWQLLHRFDSSFHSYNLEKEPFQVFASYYEDIHTFQPGWFIVNKKYTARSPKFLSRIDSLQHTGYFSKQVVAGDINAFFLSDSSQFQYVKAIIAKD
ncbi:MAG TPA: hypothetical protein VFW07_23150 [Parafilimonas sp.]|nr:hypothetical protein [Parafilimonas sp.]